MKVSRLFASIKGNIPTVTAFLIFLGYLDVQSYYGFLGIKVYVYLSSPELILSFLNLSSPIFFFLLLYIVPFKILTQEIERADQRVKKVTEKEIEDLSKEELVEQINSLDQSRKMIVKGKYFFVGMGALLIYTLSLLMWSYLSPSGHGWILDWRVMYIFLFAICLLFFVEFRRLTDRPLIPIARQTIFFLAILCVPSIILVKNRIESHELMDQDKDRILNSVQIATSSKKVYQTNFDLRYVGQTNNYIFLRDIPKQENIIIKMSDVKSLRFGIDTLRAPQKDTIVFEPDTPPTVPLEEM